MSGVDVREDGRLVLVGPLGAGGLAELRPLWERLATEERVVVLVLALGGPAGEADPAGLEALVGTPHVAIAAIEGDCLDAELELALACDLRIVAPAARLGFPGVTAGAVPATPSVRRLTATVGRTRAADLLLTGRTIDGTTATAWGLAEEAADPATRATELARTIAAGAPLAMRYAKEAVDRGYRMPLDDGLALEGDLYAILQTTADRAEGIRAFHERRSPRFTGR